MNDIHDKSAEGFRRFAASKYYIVSVAATALFFFSTGLELAGIVISAVLFAAALIFTDNERYAMPPLLTLIFQLSFRHDGDKVVNYYSQPLAIAFFAVAVIIIAAAMVFYALKIRPNRNRSFGIKNRKMLLPTAVLAAVTVLGGLFYSPYDFASLLYAFGIGGMFLAFYIGFAYLTDGTEETRIYLAKTTVSVMLLICAELIVFYAFNFPSYGILSSSWKGSMTIGWGMSNTIGALLVMLIPSAYYLMNKNVNFTFNYIAVFIAIDAVYFTMSRAALLVGVPMCVVLSVITFLSKRELRKKTAIASALFVAIVVCFALIVILTDKLSVFADFFIRNSISGSGDVSTASRGRTELWAGYWESFKSAPIFGIGFYNAFYKFMSSTMTMFSGMAHNTVFQYLGSCGIVGIAGYAYHRYASVKLYVKDYSYEKLMFAAGCAALVLMSLFDVFFTSPYFTMFYCMYLVLGENCRSDKSDKKGPVANASSVTEEKAGDDKPELTKGGDK